MTDKQLDHTDVTHDCGRNLSVQIIHNDMGMIVNMYLDTAERGVAKVGSMAFSHVTSTMIGVWDYTHTEPKYRCAECGAEWVEYDGTFCSQCGNDFVGSVEFLDEDEDEGDDDED